MSELMSNVLTVLVYIGAVAVYLILLFAIVITLAKKKGQDDN